MTTSPDRLIRKFNPGVLQSDAEVIEQFVVRQNELGIVLDVLRGNIDSQSCQHALLVAPRGQGKTMLLARVAAELRTDEYLSEHLLAVQYMEESLEIFTLADFWLETLFHLAREVAILNPELGRELRLAHTDLVSRYNEASVEGYAFAAVAAAADRLDRQLVLMVENLQALSQSVDEDFGWKLRKVLQCEPQIMLLGTATSRFAALDDAQQPFFEFFRVVVLEPLDTMGCRCLWEMVGGQPIAEREIRPLEILTGGNPRLLVLLGVFARHRSFRQLMEELVGLIDEYTEYFRGHLNVLAKTERRVYLAVIDLWQPSTAAEVAARARMDIRPVSTLLGRLRERRVINIDNSGSKRLYSASERLYCIYYKLRRERDQAGVVRLLLQFMTAFYAPRESAGLLHEFWQEAASTPGYRPWLAEAVAESSQSDEALDYHLRVAKDLVKKAQECVQNGDPKEGVAIYNEVVERFGDSGRKALQMVVVVASLNKAVLETQLGNAVEALEICDEVVTRFGSSIDPNLQQMVAMALLRKGVFLRRHLGDPTAALAAFEAVWTRFGTSDDEELLVLVAQSLVGKAVTYELIGQHAEAKSTYGNVLVNFSARDSIAFQREIAEALVGQGSACGRLGETALAIQSFDTLVGRFGGSDDGTLQEQVALALVGKGIVCGQHGETERAISNCDDVAARFGASDNLNLRSLVAMALFDKSVAQLNTSQATDAMNTCNELEDDFGTLVDPNNISYGWHADRVRAEALTAQGRTAAVIDTLRSLVTGFDPESRAMVRAMLTLVTKLIVQGIPSGDVAEVLLSDPHKAAALQPLVVAVRQHAGEMVRAPVEVMEVAADIRRIMEQPGSATQHIAQ